MADNTSLFQKLTQLFKTGAVVRRKVKRRDTTAASGGATSSSGTMLFQKSVNPSYANITANAYNIAERLNRYNDFTEMEQTAEIAAALDIYAAETAAKDEKGRSLKIFSNNKRTREILEDLFFNILNVDYNLPYWTRNLVKFGDFFLYTDVSAENGIERVFQIPVNEIEREENYDPSDPFAVRFRWNTLGNRVLENWEVCHFRLLGNDMFLPYGSSVLDPARRIWRQLILIEDAMLVYRIVRAPERRVFYIETGNIPVDAVEAYVEEQRKSLKSQAVVESATGRADMRYAPLSVSEDYFIPVRGSESGTKIDTLAGGQNAAAIEDVQYIQKKMIAALKVPRAFLGYDEALGSKSTLAAEDIRWARTIAVIQQTIIAELSKLAIIHLTAHGYSDTDILDFSLQLPNPSSISQQQKLELLRARLEVAGTAAGITGLTSLDWIRTEILEFTTDQCKKINKDLLKEKKFMNELEKEPGEGGGGGGGGGSLFGGGGGGGLGDLGGSDLGGESEPSLGDLGAPESGGGESPPEPPPEENADDEIGFGVDDDDVGILLSGDDVRDQFTPRKLDTGTKNPIKPNKYIDDARYASSRKIRNGPRSDIGGPDFMRSFRSNSADQRDPWGTPSIKDLVPEVFEKATESSQIYERTNITPYFKRVINDMRESLNMKRSQSGEKHIITEDVGEDFDVDVEII